MLISKYRNFTSIKNVFSFHRPSWFTKVSCGGKYSRYFCCIVMETSTQWWWQFHYLLHHWEMWTSKWKMGPGSIHPVGRNFNLRVKIQKCHYWKRLWFIRLLCLTVYLFFYISYYNVYYNLLSVIDQCHGPVVRVSAQQLEVMRSGKNIPVVFKILFGKVCARAGSPGISIMWLVRISCDLG